MVSPHPLRGAACTLQLVCSRAVLPTLLMLMLLADIVVIPRMPTFGDRQQFETASSSSARFADYVDQAFEDLGELGGCNMHACMHACLLA